MKFFRRFKSKPEPGTDLLILYGTKSGNSKLVALQAQKYLEKNGLSPVCKNMSGYNPVNLEKVDNLLVVVSTHGEGDPPPSAQYFFKQCLSGSMIDIRHLKYSVCALGDSSYPEFCMAGKTLGNRFAELGASPLCPGKDCDLEFSEDAVQWIKQTAELLSPKKNETRPGFPDTKVESEKVFTAKIARREILTNGTDVAPVFHIVLDTYPLNIKYKTGDSVEIFPQNPDWLADAIAGKICVAENQDTGFTALKKKLLFDFEITTLSKKTLERYAAFSANGIAEELFSSEEKLSAYLSKANVYDLITDYYSEKAVLNLPEFLPKLKSRKYSIASGSETNSCELHLTVKTVRFSFNGNNHEGAGSVYVNEFLETNGKVGFKIASGEVFQLPAGMNVPVIMVGVSTGIAPFRAMLQERETLKIKGGTWLIWGNKYRERDFLYREELERFESNGTLEKIDTVFSGDQGPFKYVYEIIAKKKDDIINWLNKGAHIYICGPVKMGKSVKNVLEEITRGTQQTPFDLAGADRWHEDVY